MNEIELKKTAEYLLNPFLEAGAESIKIAKEGFKITIKPDKTPVTNGDLLVDKILRENISNITPNIPIISEETVNIKIKNENKNFWLIDPIDGTKDYIGGRDEYTLNAALIINKSPVLGIIYAPKKKRIFYSYGKSNTYEINNGEKIPLNCKKRTAEGKIFALTHSNEPTEDILKILNENKVNNYIKMSSSYKFCVIAAGEADIYTCRARAFEWDIAAGQVIVENAGGIFTTQSGKKILYGKENYKNPPLLVKRSNNLLI